MACYLLLGRFILEAGMLDVIGPDGLVLLILGAQVLHSLGDGQPTALNVLTADSGRMGCSALQGELGALANRLHILSYTPNRHSLFLPMRKKKAVVWVSLFWDEAPVVG